MPAQFYRESKINLQNSLTTFDEKIKVEDVTQTGSQTISFGADWVVISYLFDSGRDLDTRTSITSPAINGIIGWARESQIPNNIATENAILRWSGDNTGIGYESVLLNVSKFKELYPGNSTIQLKCTCFWYGISGTTPVVLGCKFYKGGSPVLNNYYFTNPTATQTFDTASDSKLITSSDRDSPHGELISSVRLDLQNNTILFIS